MRPCTQMNNRKGQAVTELAIFGAIVLMLLGYLLQQTFSYNSKQALEMYTFRQALQLSRGNERGISLTVIRDLFTPSFFSGLSRQRVMASASVDTNAYILYTPDIPGDLTSYQLVQINDAMIKRGTFFQVPPTHMHIVPSEGDDNGPMWYSSTVREMGAQDAAPGDTRTTSQYTNVTSIDEADGVKAVTKNLSSTDTVPTIITFEDATTVLRNYRADDWAGDISSISMAGNVPGNVKLTLTETVKKGRRLETNTSD